MRLLYHNRERAFLFFAESVAIKISPAWTVTEKHRRLCYIDVGVADHLRRAGETGQPDMTEKLTYMECDLCGSDAAELELEKNGYNIVRCAGCGLVFVNPRPTEKYLAEEIYTEDYFNAEKGYGIADHFGAGRREARARADRILARIEKRMKPGKVFDVGCSAGFVLEKARERGWVAGGVEISAFAAAYARDSLGLDVATGSLTDSSIHIPAHEFDLVLMMDVIEHFTSPSAALGRAAEIIKPRGILYLNTPNYDSPAARALGAAWGNIMPEHHLFYFTPPTIEKMLHKAGFRILEMEFPLWGLSELALSAGSLSKAGIDVGLEQKNFVRKYFRAPRDLARGAASLVDRAFITPFTKHRTGVSINVLASTA